MAACLEEEEHVDVAGRAASHLLQEVRNEPLRNRPRLGAIPGGELVKGPFAEKSSEGHVCVHAELRKAWHDALAPYRKLGIILKDKMPRCSIEPRIVHEGGQDLFLKPQIQGLPSRNGVLLKMGLVAKIQVRQHEDCALLQAKGFLHVLRASQTSLQVSANSHHRNRDTVQQLSCTCYAGVIPVDSRCRGQQAALLRSLLCSDLLQLGEPLLPVVPLGGPSLVLLFGYWMDVAFPAGVAMFASIFAGQQQIAAVRSNHHLALAFLLLLGQDAFAGGGCSGRSSIGAARRSRT